jgi:PLP dependent protein
MPMATSREEDLAANLAAVEDRIRRACAAAGRSREEVTLIVVTKTWPAEDVRRLAALGVRDVGESRDQEARRKVEACADLGRAGLRWHFVGRLQTNKARSVAGYADVVHSVDRPALVDALARGARETRPRRLEPRGPTCLVQVSLDADPTRGGALPADVPALADRIAASDVLRLGGVMAVAPPGENPAAAFARLAAVAADVRRAHPQATVLSAGMSGDLEAAVAAGATHVRIGTAVLGSRPPR